MASGFITRSESTSHENRMEVVSRGSVDSFLSTAHTASRSSSKVPASRQSQTSLEYLPPDGAPPPSTRPGTGRQTSPADSEWDRILNSFEYHRQKEVGNDEEGRVSSFRHKRYGADAFWVMQAERDESSNEDDDDDSGEYVDDLESEEGSHLSPTPSQPSRDCDQQEAILKKALARIQRLDQLLADRSKKEKMLKEQRLELEKQIKLLDEQQASERTERQKRYGRSKRKGANKSTKVTAEPKSVNESDEKALVEVVETTGIPSRSISPLFATQPSDMRRSEERQSRVETCDDDEDATATAKRTNFIRRNIELASDAGNVIAMTSEEKKRLEELLVDVDEKVDEEEDSAVTALQTIISDGFTPSVDERKALDDLNERLNALVPEGHWKERTVSMISSRLSKEDGDDGIEEFLLPKQQSETERLKEIDKTLEELNSCSETEIPSLDSDQLQSLLEKCIEEQKTLGIYNARDDAELDEQ